MQTTFVERARPVANPAPETERNGNTEPSFVDALVDPGTVFAHPGEVAEHPWFMDQEKRTILLSWARDELAVEQVIKRVAPDLKLESRIDAVIEALSHFDAPAAAEYVSAVAAIRARHLRGLRPKRKHCTRGGSHHALPHHALT